MKKIIVITTGGTIASVLQDGALAVAENAGVLGGEINAAARSLGLQLEIMSPVNKNSESFAPSDWLDILAAIDEACVSDVDGVVVLHGTDTMQYSLAAACVFEQRWSKRICFSGAMLAPELPGSDARINLLGALSFAADTAYDNGIYLAFRADADNASVNIFHGSEVKPLAFDEGYFRSVYGNVVASYTAQAGLLANADYQPPSYPRINSAALPCKTALVASQQQLGYIKLYPGIDLHTLTAACGGRSVVVLELYHSGTAPVSAAYDDVLRVIEQYADSTLFALSAFPQRTLPVPYASTQALRRAGGKVYGDVQPHYLYVWCLLMSALGQGRYALGDQLSDWLIPDQ